MIVSLSSIAGCLSSEAIEQARHDETSMTKLAEVDLGEFHVTLPQATSEAGGGVVDFHAFGRVARDDETSVSSAIAERRPELRAQMLLALRSITADELAEPAVGKHRAQIATVINGALEKPSVKNVGFYSFSYTTL
jgi:hypothetical protein